MIELFLAEFRRNWRLFLRYPSESITYMLSLSLIFIALLLGVHYVASPSMPGGGLDKIIAGRMDELIVNFMLWSLTIYSLSAMGWTIQIETQTGTLEQVYLSPFGPLKVFVVRAMAELSTQLLIVAGILAIVLTVTQRSLHFTPLIIPPLVTILMATYGLGLILGGATLVFKRIQNIIQLSQFVPFFLIALPVETWTPADRIIGYALPMTPGCALLRGVMATTQGAFDLNLLLIALVNGLAYFLLGALIFTLADKIAKKFGLLGGY